MLNLPLALSRRVKSSMREGVSPLQEAVSGMSFRVKEAFSVFRGLGGIVRENRGMAAELVRVRNEVQTLKMLERENIELRNQLHFAQQAGRRKLIPCEVVGRDVSGWWQTVRISKGTVEGVASGRAVVTSEGLVGRTIDVSVRTSDVLLLSDPTCKVSARISRTGAFGVISGMGLSWKGGGGCRMDFINKNIQIRPGDEVITSGLGGVYEQGLLVGYVEKVHKDRSGLYQYAYVIPRADLGTLSHVFVVSAEEDPVEELLRAKEEAEVTVE